MNYFTIAILLLSTSISSFAAQEADQNRDSGLLTLARESVSLFQLQLRNELQAAMKKGGPIEAVSVCSTEATQIAQSISKAKQVSIKRVSTKNRNPSAKVDSQDQAVLYLFEEQLQNGGMKAKELFVSNDDNSARYYQPIVMQAICLTCHGTKLEPALARKINAIYPKDKALGYQVGDLRGAFVVQF